MSTTSDFIFNNLGRIGADSTDNTQRNISNTKYANYVLNDIINTNTQETHVLLATKFPKVNFRGNGGGAGIPGSVIDYDSVLLVKPDQEREFERLQLFQRPFATVPYLGRGSSNPVLESHLQQGEQISDMKSSSTIMDKSFMNYSTTPLMPDVQNRVTNPTYSVEEAALNGWVRGGIPSREISNDIKK
jgi:hypothetical protein